jgi:hypothetical protein
MSIIENGINLLSSDNTFDTCFDRNRTDNNGINTQKFTDRESRLNGLKEFDKCDSKTTNEQRPTDSLYQNPVIFRYKFTEEFMEELYKFSKIHQYDERKDFKEAWTLWLEDNDNIIEEESSRLNRLGFEGDVLDKMFKSARYYFRKKSIVKPEPKQRRKYITVNKDLLDKMDLHIETNLFNEDYQPKTGFIQFCEEYADLIANITQSIIEKGETDTQLINDKIKKTYKNRYFIATNNKQ